MIDALVTGQALHPVITETRANLDVIPGGEVLDQLEDLITGHIRRGRDFHHLLADALAPLAGGYDLVVVDTPPTRPTLLQLALGATRWFVVPTKPDRSSIEGLRGLANQLGEARTVNPALDLLGIVLFDVETSARVVRRHATEDITDALGGQAPLFDCVIRHAIAPAVDAREKGMLVHELAETLNDAEPYWKALQEGRRPQRIPGSAPALAEDYVLLAQEVLTRIAAHEEQEATA